MTVIAKKVNMTHLILNFMNLIMSYKKSKVPHSLIQTRIQQGVQEQVEKRWQC